MEFYGPGQTSASEIRRSLRCIKELENRHTPEEAFQKWVEVLTKVEQFKKKRVTKLEYARTKYKRPAISARAKPDLLLATAKFFGNPKMFGAFVEFPQLPKTIRYKIWLYATIPRRFLEVFLEDQNGLSVSRDKWDDDNLLNYRRACKQADIAVLTKYHKLWHQELFPLIAPNF
jgi:hypothetical protein